MTHSGHQEILLDLASRDKYLFLEQIDKDAFAEHMYLFQNICSIPMSASRIELYRKCPQAYKRSYILGERGIATDAMIIGQILHTALETYAGSEEASSKDDLLSIVEGSLLEEELKSGKELDDEIKETVRSIADGYWEDIDKQQEPIGVEVPFSINIGCANFRGVIDKITVLSKNPYTIEIRDYKSGKKAITENEMSTNLQMGIYTRAAKEAFPNATIITVLDYIRLRKETKHVFSEEEIQKIEKEAISTIDKILSDRKFETLPFKQKGALFTCAFCQHNKKCGVGRRQRKTWEAIERKREAKNK